MGGGSRSGVGGVEGGEGGEGGRSGGGDNGGIGGCRSESRGGRRRGGGGSHFLLTVVSLAVSRTGLPIEVIMDGGVQRGTDIVKALALGADAVAIGKPYLYGLCAGGEAGAHKAIDILKIELERAMGLLGVGTVRELRERQAAGEDLVRRREVSARDFPDLGAPSRGYGGGVF